MFLYDLNKKTKPYITYECVRECNIRTKAAVKGKCS